MLLKLGIDELLEEQIDWLAGRRVGLVAHPASLDGAGVASAVRLQEHPAVNLTCLMGPEHGFCGVAGPGVHVSSGVHSAWDIPVFSLYGEHRRPSAEMLDLVDVLVFDLQNLPVRCYTYASTLRYILEACAEQECRVVIADRPVPLGAVVDGPMLDDAHESFVGLISTPFCYGLTTGETAEYIREVYQIQVDLRIARMNGYAHSVCGTETDRSWVPPSPGIKTFQTACCYPVTVCCEALPALDYGRGRETIFCVMASDWMDAVVTTDALNALQLPGIMFSEVHYTAQAGLYEGKTVHGFHLSVNGVSDFKPCEAMLHILVHLRDHYGNTYWGAKGTRPGFFDQLMGTDRVRLDLLAGLSAEEMICRWQDGTRIYLQKRSGVQLYE